MDNADDQLTHITSWRCNLLTCLSKWLLDWIWMMLNRLHPSLYRNHKRNLEEPTRHHSPVMNRKKETEKILALVIEWFSVSAWLWPLCCSLPFNKLSSSFFAITRNILARRAAEIPHKRRNRFWQQVIGRRQLPKRASIYFSLRFIDRMRLSWKNCLFAQEDNRHLFSGQKFCD